MYNCSAYLVGGKEVVEAVKEYINSLAKGETILNNYKEEEVYLTGGETGILLKWVAVKWGDHYNDCSGILDILGDYQDNILEDKCVELNENTCYKLIIIYDDYNELTDEVYTNDYDDEYLGDFYLVHDVNIPKKVER